VDKSCKVRMILAVLLLTTSVLIMIAAFASVAKADEPRAKFYDFSEQLIDGEVRKPTTLYTDSRQEVKFRRLLKLKRSFARDLMKTARERVFK
tara:strand:+ start:41 stop:319 length:279 start_codon:yes stop_codon:yes gene_type:complete